LKIVVVLVLALVVVVESGTKDDDEKKNVECSMFVSCVKKVTTVPQVREKRGFSCASSQC